MKKIIAWTMAGVLGLLFLAVIGGSFYMLDYSLAPDPTREDRDSCFRELYANYPETREWMDSLRRNEALRDTFLTMPSGKRGHAYFVNRGGERTAFVIHGWRDQAIKFFYFL